jgi:hypothetical protein
MGLLTERDGAGDGFEEVTIPLALVELEAFAASRRPARGDRSADGGAARDAGPGGAVGDAVVGKGVASIGLAAVGIARSAAAGINAAGNIEAEAGPAPNGVVLRRRSAMASRRSVLYLHCERDPFVPEDLVSWYTERGFHFYVADFRAQDDRPARRRARPAQAQLLARLDAACRHLREAEGIDMIIVSAHGAGALAAALWCHARRDAGPADALILYRPAFGRRLRRGLDIACPVLVLSPADGDPRRLARRSRNDGPVRLGPHVTWLGLEDGFESLGPDTNEGRRRFLDEMGRWLGAYMYGSVRDQLL